MPYMTTSDGDYHEARSRSFGIMSPQCRTTAPLAQIDNDLDISSPCSTARSVSDQSDSLQERPQTPHVFPDAPNSKLLCPLCGRVFADPVIASCGHTFCRKCVDEAGVCPTDGASLSIFVSNIALSEQVGELMVRCTYGCRLNDAKTDYESDSEGCPILVKINQRKEHEKTCEYGWTSCPRNSACPAIRRKDLETHLAGCQNTPCPHQRYGCTHTSPEAEMCQHLDCCPYEGVKEYLQRCDERHSEMQMTLTRALDGVDLLKSVVGQLSGRVDHMQEEMVQSIETLERNQTALQTELMEVRHENSVLQEELVRLTDVMNALAVQCQALAVQQTFKCMGTFVGHMGPVWCMALYGDFLYTGSNDCTIKVWDLGQVFRVVRTLEGHKEGVITLSIFGNRIYSGGKDNAIMVWDREGLECIHSFGNAHEGWYVCSLASTKQYIISGSKFNFKVWSAETFDCILTSQPFNAWVRSLVVKDNLLYAGADEIRVHDMTNKFAVLRTISLGSDSPAMSPVSETGGPGPNVYCLLLTEEYLLCGTGSGVIHVWATHDFSPVTRLTGHTGLVNSLAAMQTATGLRIFSASQDRSVRVWRLDHIAYNICTQALVRHQGAVQALSVSKGRLFSGSVDSTVKVWVP